MNIQQLLIWFDEHKSANKTDLSNNVPKVYNCYRFVSQDYLAWNVNQLLEHVTKLYETGLVPNYKPTTVRNYIQYFLGSLDMPIIKENASEELITTTKEAIKDLLHRADKAVHDQKKTVKKPTTAEPSEDAESSLNIDINEITNVKHTNEVEDEDMETESSYDGYPEDYIQLQTENKMLKDQVEWLRKLVEKMALK